MGVIYSIYKTWFVGRDETYCICILGFAAAGKTTLRNTLLGLQVSETIPTLSDVSDTVTKHNVKLLIKDTGGQDALRVLWPIYLLQAQFVWYLIDATDKDNIPKSIEEMVKLLSTEETLSLCVAIVLTKIDDTAAISEEAFSNLFQLSCIPQFQKRIFRISSIKNIGIEQLTKWTTERCLSL